MLKAARDRIVRYTRNASSPRISEPQGTAASDEKNLSTASKNERNESPTPSGRAMAPTLRAARAREAKDGAKRLVRSRPVLVDQLRPGRPHHRPEHQGDQNRVVEMARHRDEVGDQVDRREQIAGEQDERQLAPARYPGVADEPLEKARAVGHEAGQRTRRAPAAGDHQ